MNIIGIDDRKPIVVMLEKMLERIDPEGEHRFYTQPLKVLEELDKPVDVAFLDVEMPEMNGVELAKKILERFPDCNIIFLTGHTEYMSSAFDIHASSYILKPFSQDKIEQALLHRRYRTPDMSDRPLRVQCFGSFEVFVKGEPMRFKRQKSKETLAFLIDRRGRVCDMETLVCNIEPGRPFDEAAKSSIRVYIGDLMVSFFKVGIERLIIKAQGGFAVNTALLDCDYYRYLSGDPYSLSKYNGEYMTQYSFAEQTRALLEMRFYENMGL